jgi:hypothetical protein
VSRDSKAGPNARSNLYCFACIRNRLYQLQGSKRVFLSVEREGRIVFGQLMTIAIVGIFFL